MLRGSKKNHNNYEKRFIDSVNIIWAYKTEVGLVLFVCLFLKPLMTFHSKQPKNKQEKKQLVI